MAHDHRPDWLYLVLHYSTTCSGILTWAIIVNAVASWLVAFNVINPRNGVVNMILRSLDALSRPILWPLRKVIPPLGGLDITPIIAILIIQGFQIYLLPRLAVLLASLIG